MGNHSKGNIMESKDQGYVNSRVNGTEGSVTSEEEAETSLYISPVGVVE